jgi:hypothetical protein
MKNLRLNFSAIYKMLKEYAMQERPRMAQPVLRDQQMPTVVAAPHPVNMFPLFASRDHIRHSVLLVAVLMDNPWSTLGYKNHSVMLSTRIVSILAMVAKLLSITWTLN